MLFVVMYVWSLAVSSGVIGIGGLALHRLVLRAVIVFWSVCMFLARKPLLPCISIGLSPVSALIWIFRDSVPLADAISICIFSLVGGWMPVSSGV
jgi:hypothetical protein